MATLEVNNDGRNRSPIIKKRNKSSTRVDLTPMVDLGFLLITFFMFTTTVSQSTSMKLMMPKDIPGTGTPVPRSGALTLLLAKDDLLYYYYGNGIENIRETNWRGVREIILKKKKHTPPEKLFIIIKPDKDASYKNIVDILDEMSINAIAKYALDDMSSEEYAILSNK